ncbi:RING/FYVE/PHD zinc finger superfamily protein [Raphanus sativus]|nr:RING/FYVE/PHD zinc finger superfamily protein [Raphanus sativus]
MALIPNIESQAIKNSNTHLTRSPSLIIQSIKLKYNIKSFNHKLLKSTKNTVASYTSPVHSTPASNVSMGHQWGNNSKMKFSSSVVNASATHFVKDASGIRPQFKPDVHTQTPVPAGNYFVNAASWSAQPHPSSSTISFGAFPGMKGATYGQTSSPFENNHHAEIAKIIHKVLQPRAKQNLLWNPPSS